MLLVHLIACGDGSQDGMGGNGIAGAVAGGSGGAPGAGGGQTVCTPDEQRACYDGPPVTDGVGICAPGSRICLADGSGFGPCEGQVLPGIETCDSLADEDCDGEVNEEGADCACVPGSSEPCYTGPLGTEWVGLCEPGTHTCNADGLGFGACTGDVTPSVETCAVAGDEDCDGETNEEGSDCACVPGSAQDCYSADPLTLDVGICHGGTQICNADGLGYGPCTGELTPGAEDCATTDDEDCDGETIDTSDGCVCAANQLVACYSGPPGTQGVGDCTGGTAVCNAQGTALGTCEGEVLPATEDCAVAGDESCDGVTDVCMGGQIWAYRFGNSAKQTARDVATDAAGNVLLTGDFMGQIDFGGGALVSAGGDDAYLAKLDSAGNHVWSKRFGNFTGETGRAVATDAAGSVIVGGSFGGTVDFGGGPFVGVGGGDAFLAKFDAAGTHLWSKQLGSIGSENISQIATDPSGNIIVTGVFDGTIDLAGAPLTAITATDAFVLKLDPDGGHVWSKRFDTANAWTPIRLAVDSAGSVVLTGRFQNPITFGGLTFSSSGTGDVFVAKLDANGDHVWSQRFGGTGIDTGERVAVDSAGSVLLTGTFTSATIDFGGGPLANVDPPLQSDMFLVKLAPWGAHLWSKRFGSTTLDDRGLAVTSDAAGNVFLGARGGTGLDLGGGVLPGSSGATIGMFDASGNHVWSKRYGDSGDDVVTVTTDGAGDLLFTGSFNGSLSFGGSSLTSLGSFDVYAVKLGP